MELFDLYQCRIYQSIKRMVSLPPPCNSTHQRQGQIDALFLLRSRTRHENVYRSLCFPPFIHILYAPEGKENTQRNTPTQKTTALSHLNLFTFPPRHVRILFSFYAALFHIGITPFSAQFCLSPIRRPKPKKASLSFRFF